MKVHSWIPTMKTSSAKLLKADPPCCLIWLLFQNSLSSAGSQFHQIMRKYLFLATVISSLLISSCAPKPERYFDLAVLSANMISDFGGRLEYEMEHPSVTLLEGTKDQTRPMKRSEIIENKIQYVEEHLNDIKGLKETDDSRDILKASISLHEYVLPVFKTEYKQLAGLYDNGASKEDIAAYQQSIWEKYGSRFSQLFDALTSAGKKYAGKHDIKVNWDVKTSPDL
jgi:hypothetical protein